ncbi:MAG: hypothetical protein HYZ26_02925 [Chloroflexi bacterium]|nr:hypothetical protein [Chloroflexota bacterium]
MQIMQTCTHCRTPYSLKEPEIVSALAQITANNFKYYTASCPNCGKPNKIPAAQLRRVAPKSTSASTAKAAPRPKAQRKAAATAANPKAGSKKPEKSTRSEAGD